MSCDTLSWIYVNWYGLYNFVGYHKYIEDSCKVKILEEIQRVSFDPIRLTTINLVEKSTWLVSARLILPHQPTYCFPQVPMPYCQKLTTESTEKSFSIKELETFLLPPPLCPHKINLFIPCLSFITLKLINSPTLFSIALKYVSSCASYTI